MVDDGPLSPEAAQRRLNQILYDLAGYRKNGVDTTGNDFAPTRFEIKRLRELARGTGGMQASGEGEGGGPFNADEYVQDNLQDLASFVWANQGDYNPDVDPRLIAIIEEARSYTPFLVELDSGFRPGDPREHGKHHAIDVVLIDPATGAELPNYQDGRNFREYEQFAQAARAIQMAKYPELENKFRWGGYFGGKDKKGNFSPTGYGAFDLMHFDVESKHSMAQGSWEGGLSSVMKRHYGVAETVGMGQNARSRGYLATLTPGGYTPKPPAPASPTTALALQRNSTPAGNATDAASALVGGTQMPAVADPNAPVTMSPGLAAARGNPAERGRANALPYPATATAGLATARTLDPNAPQPAVRPASRMPAGSQPGLGMPDTQIAEVYQGTPNRLLTPADIYKGTPNYPEGVPMAAPGKQDRYVPPDIKVFDDRVPAAEVIPASYPASGATAPSGFDPVVDPLAQERRVAFTKQIPPLPAITPVGVSGTEVGTQQPNVPQGPQARSSDALKAARARLAAERAKRVGEAAVAEPKATNFVRPEGPAGGMPAAKIAPTPATQSPQLAASRVPKTAPTPAIRRNALGAPTPAVQTEGLRQNRNALSRVQASYQRSLAEAQNALTQLRPGANLISIFGGARAPGNTLAAGGAAGNVLRPGPAVQVNSARDGLSGAQIDIAQRQARGNDNYQSLIEWAMRN